MAMIRTLLALTMSCACAISVAQPNTDLDIYARPGERVDIGHARLLNLRCSGEGKITVVLESGAVADSFDWYKVQPKVAAFARVCSYDRAGYGFSDGVASKNYFAGSADDLHALIRAAHIATPIVLVGHSLGTDIAREYVTRFPKDVAALVLVDPPPQDIRGAAETQRRERDEAIAARTAMLAACKKGAAKLQDATPPPELKNCLRPPNTDYSDALNAARRTAKTKPAFWDSAGYALDASGLLDSQPFPTTENHGSLPLLILQPDEPFGDVSPDERKMLEQARQRTHELIAATSKRSEIIPVVHSTHDVQFAQPDAVVGAIRKAISESSHP